MPVLARDLTLALTPGAASMTTECEGNNRELDSDAPWPCDFVPGQMVRARARATPRAARWCRAALHRGVSSLPSRCRSAPRSPAAECALL